MIEDHFDLPAGRFLFLFLKGKPALSTSNATLKGREDFPLGIKGERG